jgi:hypothetical protein
VQCSHRCKADSEQKMVRGGRAEAPGPCSDVSFRLDQKTTNFKAATVSTVMQWSAVTEENQKNELAQTEFRFIKTSRIITGWQYGITIGLSPLYQRCTAAKDGKFQDGHSEQRYAVEWFH